MTNVSATECCSVLQCVVVCCSVSQCVAVCCTLTFVNEKYLCYKPVAVCCSVLQCVAVCCSVLHIDICQWQMSLLQACCSVLQCVAVCRSVLQCVTVCCSVLHIDICQWQMSRLQAKNNPKEVLRHWLWGTFPFSFLWKHLQKSKKNRTVLTFGDISLFICETMSPKTNVSRLLRNVGFYFRH